LFHAQPHRKYALRLGKAIIYDQPGAASHAFCTQIAMMCHIFGHSFQAQPHRTYVFSSREIDHF
jgi:hypothetical protein